MSKGGNIKKLKLLLVEDNKLNQKLIESSLRKFGYSIDIANNGIEALEKFSPGKYNVILMDIMMPVMDGFEATARIRKIETKGRIPIIALTANTLNYDREKCLASGMDEYISKPLSIEKLHKAFNDLGITI